MYIVIELFRQVSSATTGTVVSSTGRVRRAALHTYIPIYDAMDSSTTYDS